jgi:hypothetical protein
LPVALAIVFGVVMITGFLPAIVWWNAWPPMGRATSRTPVIDLSLRNCCAHAWPCSSPEATLQVTTFTGCPPTPPSFSLRNFTAAPAAAEPSGKLGTPPSSLMSPNVMGDLDESAAPAVPPTYVDSWLVACSRPAPALGDVLDVEPEPELDPESLSPHAAIASAATTHAAAALKPRIGLLLMTLSSIAFGPTRDPDA